jgi:NADH-quinone oxidoreductase subunit G
MPEIIIDGKVHEVSRDRNLLEAILLLGYDLPYFCWHPALGSVGSCRQCAIRKFRNPEDSNGQIVMSCMEPVTDNLRISLREPGVEEFRKNVIEWLMTNHPHDCPICDEGGECHLQDMTVMTGHAYRRFRYKKRTYNNQYLGPCINHEMNRCIQCYRCVRFYNDYAGGDDLQVFSAHNHVYFGRHEDGVLESEFSGNLVEVCPTGVFTDKTLKNHYTRKWDFTSSPSVCHHCSLGCNVLGGERYGTLRRILSRYNEKVNGYFICDRGRFGYDFVNGEQRLRNPMVARDSDTKPVSSKEALVKISKAIGDGNQVIGVGSPRASVESNFALRKLVGEDHFYNGIAGQENKLIQTAIDFLRNGPVRTPSLKEIENCDAVIIIGEDVTNTAPMIDLALKQSVHLQPLKKIEKAGIPSWHDSAVREYIQNERGPLYIVTPQKTKLDGIASGCFHKDPVKLIHLIDSIAYQLDKSLLKPDEKSDGENVISEIAAALAEAERPLVIAGTSLGSEEMLRAAINLSLALHHVNKNTEIAFVFPECNTLGVGMLEPKSLQDAIVTKDKFETLIIVENDLFRRMPQGEVTSFLSRFKNVIVVDHTSNETTEKANVVLPGGTFAEADGTLVNNEGRAQRFFQVQAAGDDVQETWRWIVQTGESGGLETFKNWKSLDDVILAIEDELPLFKGISKAAPLAKHRINNQKMPRAPHRYSGRTAMFANRKVNEPRPPKDDDSPYSFTMEGFNRKLPANETPFYWSPGWNSVQSINKFKIEVGGELHKQDPGVRLIEPTRGSTLSYLTRSSNGVAKEEKKWRLIPVHYIFGSEEMSIKSDALVQRSPGPFCMVNAVEASNLGISDGEPISFTAHDQQISLAAVLDAGWPERTLGFSSGFPVMPFIEPGILVEPKKVNRHEY